MIAHRKRKKNTKEKRGSPKGVPLVCVFQPKREAAPTHTEIDPSSGAPFVLFCVCVVVCQIVPNEKKQRTHVTENSLTS